MSLRIAPRALAAMLVIAGVAALSDQMPAAALLAVMLVGIGVVYGAASLMQHTAANLTAAARYRRRHEPLAGPRPGARLA